LGRLFGGGDRTESVTVSVVMFDQQRQDAELPIVGESYRQEQLARFVRTRGQRGVTHGNLTAVLQPEPTNPKDKNAIRILLRDAEGNGAHVGYLGREDAKLYGPIVRYLSPRLIQTRARLIGGWVDPVRGDGSIGVLLNLGTPSEVAGEVVCADWAVPEHRWAGKTVCFVGPSLHAACGVRLERTTQDLLARRAGCVTAPRPTKKVHLVVVGHASSAASHLDRARDYGIELVAETAFWTTLGLRLEPW